MAVVFKTLTRGLWKNRATPEVSKTYQYRITVDPEGSHKIFQPKVRSNSTLVGRKYNYDPALEVPGKILFGTSPSQTQYDFSDFAWMPFKQPENVVYKAHSKEMNIPLTIHRDNQVKPYSSYSSRFSSRSGIYYGKLKSQVTEITMSSFDWSGVSVADKYSIPTLMQISTYPRQYAAGAIMTKSIGRLGSTVDRDIYIYQNRIVDGDDTLWMDDDDHNARIRYVYIVLQSPGGSGGVGQFMTNGFWSSWISGTGGGGGAWSLDLVRIPDDGYIKVRIPETPTIGSSYEHYHGGKRSGTVRMTDDQNYLLREMTGGEWGLTPKYDFWGVEENVLDGGYGGKITNKINPTYLLSKSSIKNIRYCNGSDGCKNSKWKDYETRELAVSGSSPQMIINAGDFVDTVLTDGTITIPAVPGITQHWPNNDDTNIPGGGGSAPLGRGGDYRLNDSGLSGDGPGAGGGGGSKEVFTDNPGGAGCTAAVYIGY